MKKKKETKEGVKEINTKEKDEEGEEEKKKASELRR